MTDEQTAAAIVADAAANDELQRGNDPTTLRAAIVAALAEVRMKATGQATQRTIDAAFREGYEAALDRNANGAVLKMCHEARMMNGIVDYSDPNATGVVRRVVTKSIGPIAYPTGDYVHVLRVEASWEEMSKAAESAKEAK